MDSNRSLVVVAVGSLVILTVLLGVSTVLMQGVQQDGLVRVVAQSRDLESIYEEDPVAPPKPSGPRVNRAVSHTPRLYEDWTPSNRTEKAWEEELLRQENEQVANEARRSRYEAWSQFIESPVGGDLQAAFELFRRGHPEEAVQALQDLLPALEDQPPEVQQPVLAAAMRLFDQAGRSQEAAQAMYRYLEAFEAQLTGTELEGALQDKRTQIYDEIQSMKSQLQSRGVGS